MNQYNLFVALSFEAPPGFLSAVEGFPSVTRWTEGLSRLSHSKGFADKGLDKSHTEMR